MKLQEIISRPDVSVDSISRILISDPVLTAHVLKIVNSAYYSLKREIDDIKFAVAYLGIHEIFNITLTLSVVQTIMTGERKEQEDFWAHSIMTALCAKHLGQLYEPLLSPEKLWIGAMLHDIGKLVYHKFYPDHYNAVKGYAQINGVLFSHAEEHFCFPSSALMGSVLCDHWRLPKIVKDACEYHTIKTLENLSEGSRKDFQKIICAANLMATLSTETLATDVKQDLFTQLSALFNLSEKDFLKLMGEIYDLKLDLANYRW
jgi:HD-like signal output (HDOD) protein